MSTPKLSSGAALASNVVLLRRSLPCTFSMKKAATAPCLYLGYQLDSTKYTTVATWMSQERRENKEVTGLTDRRHFSSELKQTKYLL